MELYLLLHSVAMHVAAALVVLVCIPLSVPAKLLVRALVKPARKEDLRGKVVLITGASSGIGEDVNFWGSVYPTHYALPHLKASRGKLVVCCSAAGTVPTSRMAFYNVSMLTAGYVESEITKGKGIQKDGEVAVDKDARDAQIGVFPVGRVEALCEVALDGDWYVTWPSLYRPLQLVACLAPEVLSWVSYAMYKEDARGSRPLGQRILEATGAKRLYPPSLRHDPDVKTD